MPNKCNLATIGHVVIYTHYACNIRTIHFRNIYKNYVFTHFGIVGQSTHMGYNPYL